ncbi:MAG: dihydrolipoamide acetyltransferase family protein [Actinomycetota bacterium]
MSEFRLPDVGEGLEEAEIVEWLVAEGESVARDQPLVEILTDKSQTQLPSPTDGVITRLAFAEGDMVTVGQVLVEFGGGAGAGASPAAPATATSTAAPGGAAATATAQPASATPAVPGAAAEATPAPSTAASGAPAGGRPKAAPVVRRRALDEGIDLGTVAGTGPGGRITLADLDRHANGVQATPPQPGAPDEPLAAPPPPIAPTSPPPASTTLGQMAVGTHPLRGVRRVTAEAMARSWDIPHIHGNDECDASAVLAARRRMRDADPTGASQLTPLAFFVVAVANALRRHPLLNASIDPAAGTITVHPDVNIGIAVASEQGLYVPVIRHADRRSLYDLAAEIARLSAAVRDGSITAADMSGGTATISNFGSLGGRFATPIIRAPEVAIVGFGSIKERPLVVDGELVARPTLPISTAVDHRLIDGDLSTAFQEYLISQLTDPVMLLAR